MHVSVSRTCISKSEEVCADTKLQMESPGVLSSKRKRTASSDSESQLVTAQISRRVRSHKKSHFLNFEAITKRYRKNNLAHNSASIRVYNSIFLEKIKSALDYYERICKELEGYSLALLSDLYEIFDISTPENKSNMTASDLIQNFASNFLRNYSLVKSSIGDFDSFF